MEVLREQPQNIPHFAATYFAELLKKREESGFDPAEWGAALEDRYYNNHSFQHPEDKTFTARTEDVFYSTVDGQLSQDLTSPVQEKEKYENKLVEDDTLPAHTEDVSDGKESAPVLDNSEDTLEPDHRPSSSQAAEEERKEEKSDTDNLLWEQSATVIQAAFRGRQAREGVRRLKEESGENNLLSPQESPTSEEAAPQDTDQREKDTGADLTEDAEPRPAETPQEDATPVQPHDGDTETREDNAATAQDVFHGALDEHLEMGQSQDLQDEEEEQKEADQEAEDHDRQATHSEEDKEDNVPIKEDVDGPDMTQTHREEDNVATEGDDQDIHVNEEKTIMGSEGLEGAAGPSSTEGPDTSETQEAQSQKAETTDEQQESADNRDIEAKDQLEDKSGEPADTTTEITGERQEDPKEENEALRKQVEEALDIALDDPDANAAAAKIQAGFRGHMTRKKMKVGDKDVKHNEDKEGSSAQAEHEGD